MTRTGRLAIPAFALALALAGCASTVVTTPKPAPTSTTSPTPNSLILAPATVPSAVGICSQQMSFGADGNASPIICSNGAVNVLAWNYLWLNAPALFAAGPDATQVQVAALVAQLQGPTPSNESEFCLAAAYYDWQFAIDLDPASEGLPGNGCNVDFPHWP